MSIKIIRNALLVASLSAALAACGGGGSNSNNQDNDPTTTPRPVEPIDPPGQIPPTDSGQDNDQPPPDDGTDQTPVDPAPDDSEPQPDNGTEQPLPPSSDEEEPEVDNSAHLQWESPNTRTDAQCLTDLVAYRISYGLSSGVYTNTETVEAKDLTCTDSGEHNDCGQISTCGYTVQDLDTASWYFAVQAVDSSGNLSDYSNEGIKTIQ